VLGATQCLTTGGWMCPPRPLDQASVQPTGRAQPALQARHPAAVGRVVVIVTQKVQEPM
jgi:hypothetical protein